MDQKVLTKNQINKAESTKFQSNNEVNHSQTILSSLKSTPDQIAN